MWFGTIRRVARAMLVIAAVYTPPAPGPIAVAPVPIPNGYTIANRQELAPGLTYVQYRSTSPRRVVNVAILRRSAPEHFRMVLSNERVAGPLPRTETVSSMCKRVGCTIAVNGDFFSTTTGQPAGGVAYEGVPIRTPPGGRYHFVEDWAGNVNVIKAGLPIGFKVPYPNGMKPFYVHAVNAPRPDNRAHIYTPKWGPSTETAGGFEIVLRLDTPLVRMDQTHRVTIVRGVAAGNTPIPSDGVVLSGSGSHATALAQLWRDVQSGVASAQAELVFDSAPDLRMYTGGSPALLLNGTQGFVNDGSAFLTRRDPKTMAGRTAAGDAVLAVVDGRQPDWSVGMSMTEAMQFMRSLGCVSALNLDGGGSSTFVKNGVVINKPSDGRERPIAIALAVVA